MYPKSCQHHDAVDKRCTKQVTSIIAKIGLRYGETVTKENREKDLNKRYRSYISKQPAMRILKLIKDELIPRPNAAVPPFAARGQAKIKNVLRSLDRQETRFHAMLVQGLGELYCLAERCDLILVTKDEVRRDAVFPISDLVERTEEASEIGIRIWEFIAIPGKTVEQE
jgi:hypothetical protein